MKTWQFIGLQIIMLISGIFAYVVGQEYLSLLPMLLLAVPAYWGLIRHNKKKGIAFLIFLSLYATIIEATSILTGFPYGFFTYGAVLGQKLFGVVPWAVSFGWVPLVIGAILIASTFVKKKIHLYMLSVGLLVASDLVIDPGAVALGFWTWITTGAYYTIPFVNYLGWLFSSLIGIGIFFWYFTYSDIQQLPHYATLTLVLGNIFWIGVTVVAHMYIASAVGFILQIGMNYSFTKRRQVKSQQNQQLH